MKNLFPKDHPLNKYLFGVAFYLKRKSSQASTLLFFSKAIPKRSYFDFCARIFLKKLTNYSNQNKNITKFY